MNIVWLCGPVLLTFVCEGEGPVRFGFPLPAKHLTRGLYVSDTDARLQWRQSPACRLRADGDAHDAVNAA